jgi:hypothetical protein
MISSRANSSGRSSARKCDASRPRPRTSLAHRSSVAAPTRVPSSRGVKPSNTRPTLPAGCGGETRGEYGRRIDDEPRKPRHTARELARAVESGRKVGAALRHLDGHGSEPDALGVAEALARFLVARCDSHHVGWRVVRQVVVDSAADAPWEKCARRAVPLVAEDLISLASDPGRTPLARAQHIAAQRRAEQIAVHVDQAALLADLGLKRSAATPERWRIALSSAVDARSREQVARAVDRSLRA